MKNISVLCSIKGGRRVVVTTPQIEYDILSDEQCEKVNAAIEQIKDAAQTLQNIVNGQISLN